MMQRNQRLIIVLSTLLIVGFLVTSLASFFVSRASLGSQISLNALPLTSDNIYSEIQRDLLIPINISSLMATDTFLRDWVIAGEKDSTRVIRYLKDIQLRYNTFTSFFVSDKTRNYYQSDRILKKVAREEERDAWYFRVRSMQEPYEINVDPDMAHQDAMTIFVNYRMRDYEGNYIGATGVGLAVTAVKELIESYQHKYGRRIFFMDSQGRVTLHGSSFPGSISGIDDMKDLAPLRDKIFNGGSGSLRYRSGGETRYLNTRYIKEFDWYLFVEQADAAAMRGIFNTLLVNLLVCLFITLVVMSLTWVTLSSYQKTMENMAATDKLTGFYNRRTFDVILEQAIRDSRRSGAPLSLILFDIDHFKEVNDTFGHLAGDAVIAKIAEANRASLRESDVSCRWGGEEFIVLLKGCGLNDACAMAERIRAVIQETPVAYEGRNITVSVSLGVVEYSSTEEKSDLIKRADRAMYAAKERGRNCSERG